MNPNFRNFALWVVIFLLVLALVTLFQSPSQRASTNEIPYSQLINESEAGRIAKALVEARTRTPIATTGELASIVQEAVPRSRRGRIHPATRTFQALRIYVNEEMASLRAALEQGIDLLSPGGRVCVISYHSLEDRLVKNAFRAAERI